MHVYTLQYIVSRVNNTLGSVSNCHIVAETSPRTLFLHIFGHSRILGVAKQKKMAAKFAQQDLLTVLVSLQWQYCNSDFSSNLKFPSMLSTASSSALHARFYTCF